MKPYLEMDKVTVYCGDCRDVLPGISQVDAVVTDPPYGLGFMGKDWDAGVPGVGFWELVCAAMKPGAHLLAFGGTRTFHRLTCAIEDAGLEIRDCVMWLYGSGFPKSLDVSKAIDKRDDERKPAREAVGRWLKAQRLKAGLNQKQVAVHWPSVTGGLTGCVANWELGLNCPTWDQWIQLKQIIGFGDELDAEVWRLNGRKGKPGAAWADRQVVGQYEGDMGGLAGQRLGQAGGDITASATDAAKQWDGWGTALKPAYEPIILARKPLEGTVAANVLAHGVGGLNIDGCRVEVTEAGGRPALDARAKVTPSQFGAMGGSKAVGTTDQGRWPANVIHDGSDEVTRHFPESEAGNETGIRGTGGIWSESSGIPCGPQYGDKGSAARFFYCAKASRAERTKSNTHPTVKPISLMRYLCKLITPPGGLVLDPFMGSGSTLVAAREDGFRSIGIELSEDYCKLIAKRLEQGLLDFGAP